MEDDWLIVSCVTDSWMNVSMVLENAKRWVADRSNNAQSIAEVKDPSKDSATSSHAILRSIDQLRRSEQDESGSNSLSCPPVVSDSTYKRAVRRVAPVRIRRGGF